MEGLKISGQLIENKIEIITENGVTKIKLDGRELKGVRKITYENEVNKGCVATIEIYTKVATIDSYSVVNINNAFSKNNNSI